MTDVCRRTAAGISDRLLSLTLLLLCLTGARIAHAEPLSVAVAANFQSTFRDLAGAFEARTGREIRHSAASSGVLYAQILAGARFDLFLSADRERPMRLEESGHGIAASRFTYAIGQLALWVPGNPRTEEIGLAALEGMEHRLAMANPATAPYGVAAEQLLTRAAPTHALRYQRILGNNVTQAFQFAISGNVSAALIAYSHVIEWRRLHPDSIAPAEVWLVPADRHDPILQQCILLRREPPHPAAVEFVGYLQSSEGRGIIADHGYRLAPETGM